MAKKKYSQEEKQAAREDFEYRFAAEFYPKYCECKKNGTSQSDAGLLDTAQELLRLSEICGIKIDDYHAGFNAGVKYKGSDDNI